MVLIVAKCNVNSIEEDEDDMLTNVLIVAKCNVNIISGTWGFLLEKY